MNKPVRPPPLSDDPTDAELEAYLLAIGPPPGQEDLTDEELEARAEAEIAEGRFFSHELVMRHLKAIIEDPSAPLPEPDVCIE